MPRASSHPERREAQLLLDLIEMLFDEWYVARHQRQQRLARIAQASAEKKQAIADARAGQLNQLDHLVLREVAMFGLFYGWFEKHVSISLIVDHELRGK